MVTFYSFCWAVLISSIFIVALYLLRKRTFFLLNFGFQTLLLLFVFCLIRMLIPFEFSHQKVISDSHLYAFIMYPYILSAKYHIYLLYFIVAVWVIGSSIFTYRFFKKTHLLYAYLKSVNKSVSDIATKIFLQIDSQKKLNIFEIPDIEVPFLAGIIHPTIYIPTYKYTEEQLYYILLHEYTHYKNKDLWVKFLCNLFCIIFWWNPIVYLLPKDLNAILELKCDATLAKKLTEQEKVNYLDTILFTLRCVNNNKIHTDELSFTTAFVQAKNNFTKERFLYLLKNNKKSDWIYSYIVKFITITLLCFSFIASYYFILQPSYDTPKDELWDENTGAIIDSSNSYLSPKDSNTYYLYYNNVLIGELPAEDVNSGYCDLPIRKE